MTDPKKPSRAELQPKDSETHLSADLQTFEGLPTQTKHLLLLSDEAEKVAGKQRAKLDKKIKAPAGRSKY
jgi:hypothetical protein